jgi:hypothetical protein
MELDKKIMLSRVVFLMAIVYMTSKVVGLFVMSILRVISGTNVMLVGRKELFLPLICVVLLAEFWKLLKREYILLVLGLISIFGVLYEPFHFSNQLIIIIQPLGTVIFAVAVIRISKFLLSKQSNQFIEDRLLRHK